MLYLVLIYQDDAEPATPEEQAAIGEAYGAFNAFLAESGALRGTSPWPAGITTVRTRAGGEPTASDGPHVEAGERVAGFFLIDVEDRDAAVAIAARVPAARYGAVEVRPVQVPPQ